MNDNVLYHSRRGLERLCWIEPKHRDFGDHFSKMDQISASTRWSRFAVLRSSQWAAPARTYLMILLLYGDICRSAGFCGWSSSVASILHDLRSLAIASKQASPHHYGDD